MSLKKSKSALLALKFVPLSTETMLHIHIHQQVELFIFNLILAVMNYLKA